MAGMVGNGIDFGPRLSRVPIRFRPPTFGRCDFLIRSIRARTVMNPGSLGEPVTTDKTTSNIRVGEGAMHTLPLTLWLLACAFAPGAAAEYPEKPIRLVVPQAAG